MEISPLSLLSEQDLSTESPSQNAIELCPLCSRPTPIPHKLADAIREAHERAAIAQQLLQKERKMYQNGKKWVEKAKEKNNRLFLEKQQFEKDNLQLKFKIQEMQAQIENLEVLLQVTRKLIFKKDQDKLTPTQPSYKNRSITPDRQQNRPEPQPSLSKEKQFFMKDRQVYFGEMSNGVPHGKGCLFIQVGQYYQGEFKKHKLQGFGKMKNLVTNEYYQGQWANSKRNGRGTKIAGNVRYEGEFKDDVIEGWGEMTDMQSGRKCVGYWKNNQFQGVTDSSLFHS